MGSSQAARARDIRPDVGPRPKRRSGIDRGRSKGSRQGLLEQGMHFNLLRPQQEQIATLAFFRNLRGQT